MTTDAFPALSLVPKTDLEMKAKDFKNIEVTQAMLDRYDRIWDTQKVKPKTSPDSKPSASSERPSSAAPRCGGAVCHSAVN